MLLSIIALCSFVLSSCGSDSKDDPKGDDLGDGLKTGFYAGPIYSGHISCNEPGSPHYFGKRRRLIKIVDNSTLIEYTYSSTWAVADNNSCGNSKGSIEIDGNAWYYNHSVIYSYIKNGNKIIVPNWGSGLIFNILPDGSLLIDGWSPDEAYHHVAN